ncbi:MAG: T9SS type A sorting domain-containing protein [Rhizobacter sp.]|nr:T9SS type A sorting domain-containing protein [Chlorobiales bacterium]
MQPSGSTAVLIHASDHKSKLIHPKNTQIMTLKVTTRCLLFLPLILLSFLPATATAQTPFIVKDILVSDSIAQIIDPEFDPYGNRVSWQSLSDTLWLAKIDPKTGELIPKSGKGIYVDRQLLPIPETFNGPEWMQSVSGGQLVYTTNRNSIAQLAVATETATDVWGTQIIAGTEGRLNPRATKYPASLVPAVHYLRRNGESILWSPAGSTAIQEDSALQTTDAHWVNDEPDAFTLIIRSNDQVGYYDTQTKLTTQLTFDNTKKERPYMWKAPEYGNDLVFFARADTLLQLYRKDAVSGVWTKFYEFTSPLISDANYTYIASPEPFVFNGKSYVCFMITKTNLETDNNPAQIWIAGIDPDAPFFRRVSDDTPLVRTDPEPFITDSTVFVFYTVVSDLDGNLDATSNLNMRLCETGLVTAMSSASPSASNTPGAFSLSQNYPNPFNPATTISYAIPQAASVRLRVYDMLGREVATLVDTKQAAGSYTARFDASRFASGIYFYRLQSGASVQTKKMLLVK